MRLRFGLVALLGAPLAAGAAPVVEIAVSRTQDCVAPCAVFFDATATRDPSTPHPFHQLDFRWDFGDEQGEVWAISGQPKNRAIGGIAGHLYTRPGRHRVRLEVANPAGERAAAERSVVVADPATTFAGDATVCVSSRGDFDGCPAGAKRLRNDAFESVVANAPGRRTLLRRGETFAWSRTVHLADASARGSAIGVFGPGKERAIVRAKPGVRLDPGDDWRISHLELRSSGGAPPVSAITEHEGVRRFTAHDVAVRGFNGCATFWSQSKPDREVALVDVSCGEFPDPGVGTKLFEDTEESMFLGLDIDKGEHADPRDQTEFAFRSVFSIRKLIQHSRFRGRAPVHSKNLLQLRHCPTGGEWAARCSNGTTPSRYVLVSDNHLIEGGGPRTGTVIRTCDHGACAGDKGHSNRLEDYIFERNLIQLAGRGANDQLMSVFQLQAARTSVRHNVADLQGWPAAGAPRAWFVLADPFSNASRDRTRELWIHHNTLYFGADLAKSIVLCGARGATAELACSHNLVYAPGLRGTITTTVGEGWTAEANRTAPENPFRVSPPARLATTLRDLGAFRGAAGETAGADVERAAPPAGPG